MISSYSVKKPYTVIVAVVLALVLGVVSFMNMTTDLLPSMDLNYAIVMTTYIGASPETVEEAITKPIEQSMATISNIQSISSTSSENYSMVILEFAETVNMDSATLDMRESLDQLASYWDDSVGSPIIMKLNPDMMPIMVAAAGKEGMNPAEISEYAEDKIIPELESIEGVASVSAVGLVEESVQVIIRQEKIDEINKQVFGYIEGEFVEGEQEIKDGKQELIDGQNEINDGRVELIDGRVELQDGKDDVAEGLSEIEHALNSLKSATSSTATELANQKVELQGARSELQKQITLLEVQWGAYKGLSDAVIEAQTALEEYKTANPEVDATDEKLIELQTAFTTAQGIFDAYKTANPTLTEEGYAIYQGTVTMLQEKVTEIDAGLKKIEAGEMEAATQLGSGTAVLQITQGNLESVEEQLDSSQEQLDDAEEQLNDAEKGIKDGWESLIDGEKELADAKKDALDGADMTDVLTIETVQNLLMAQNFSMPAGYVTEKGVDYLVRVGDIVDDLEGLQSMPILDLQMEGVDTIYLSDVADVFQVTNEDEVYARVNGEHGIMLTMEKQTGYSTGNVSNLINEKFETLQEEDEGLNLVSLMDQGIYMKLVTDSVYNNMISGAILAVLVLLFFLRNIRPTIVIACSIPISVIVAVVCMYFSGVTLNMISLSGLALGIGMLVDNSIVVIENIYRMRSMGMEAKKAAVEGAKEVSGAIAASTLTTVCVFLPIVFIDGITKQLFVDMGLTIAYSLLASLAIALSFVPMMGAKLFEVKKEEKPTKIGTKIMNGYEKLIRVSLKYKVVVVLLAIALLVTSVVAAVSNGTAFMGEMDSTQMSMTLTMPEGTLLEETAEVSDEVIERVLQLDDVEDIGAMTVSGGMMGMGGNVAQNQISLYAVLKEDKALTNLEIKNEILKMTEDLDCELNVTTSNMDISALSGSGISIEIQGRDLDVLQEMAEDIKTLVESVEGTTEVSDGLEDATQEMSIIIDKEAATKKGLTTAGIFAQISTKLADAKSATTLKTSDNEYDVFVLNGEDEELTRALLQEIMIDTTDGDKKNVEIPLSEIASFEDTETPSSISRTDQTRHMNVTAGVADGYNISFVSTDVQNLLDQYEIPSGYSVEMAGEDESINEAIYQLSQMIALAILFMYLIMVAQFQSLLSPFIILFTVPLAFTGGFLGLFFTGSEIDIMAMIGFVMLSGIIVNNGIVLIDYTNQLCAEGLEKKEALVEAGKTRMRPIFMTALTTILGLSTMALGIGMGSELMQPMAIVTIGGLLYGTLLTLFVIPCVYDFLVRKKK